MSKPNTHSHAASSYDTNVKQTSGNSRELEARALLKSARRLSELQSRWDEVEHTELDEALSSNRKLWMLFFDEAMENTEGLRPNDLRSNIVNLSNFIFKRTVDIMAHPDKSKLEILITINREIASGLSKKVDNGESKQTSSGGDHMPFAGVSA